MNDALAKAHGTGLFGGLGCSIIHERLLPLLERDNVLPVRYERWFKADLSDRGSLQVWALR